MALLECAFDTGLFDDLSSGHREPSGVSDFVEFFDDGVLDGAEIVIEWSEVDRSEHVRESQKEATIDSG